MTRRVCVLLAAMFLLSALSMTALAEEIDFAKEGSITVKVIDSGTPLKGLKLTCIRVANVEENNGYYEFVRVYARKHYTKTDIQDPDFPETIYKFVKNNASNYKFSRLTEEASDKGYVTFEGCKPGLYLIIQEEEYSLNGVKYSKLSPFVVSIPYDGKYDVNASSKPELDIFPTDPPPTTKPPQRLPQTGQNNSLIPVLASSGMLLFALGWWLFFGRRKDSYDA